MRGLQQKPSKHLLTHIESISKKNKKPKTETKHSQTPQKTSPSLKIQPFFKRFMGQVPLKSQSHPKVASHLFEQHHTGAFSSTQIRPSDAFQVGRRIENKKRPTDGNKIIILLEKKWNFETSLFAKKKHLYP